MGWSMYEQLVFALFVEQQMFNRLHGSGLPLNSIFLKNTFSLWSRLLLQPLHDSGGQSGER